MAQVDLAAARLSAALDKLETLLAADGRASPPVPSEAIASEAGARLDQMEQTIDRAIEELAPIVAALEEKLPHA